MLFVKLNRYFLNLIRGCISLYTRYVFFKTAARKGPGSSGNFNTIFAPAAEPELAFQLKFFNRPGLHLNFKIFHLAILRDRLEVDRYDLCKLGFE